MKRADLTVFVFYFFHFQEKKFVQMVKDAGSSGIEKQIIGQKNLKSLEARYEQTLQQLANVIKVGDSTNALAVLKPYLHVPGFLGNVAFYAVCT